MKLFLYILSSLFFLSCSNSPLQKKKKEGINDSASIKSIIESIYQTKENLNKGKFHSQKIYKYDQQSNEIENHEIDSNGSLTLKVIHHYDYSKKQVIESYYYNKNDSLQSIEKPYYNDQGNKIKWIAYDTKDNIISKGIFEYNENGKLSKSFYYSANDKLNFN